MLLQPLKEQLDLLPDVIRVHHFQGIDVQGIVKEDELPAVFGVYMTLLIFLLLAHGQLSELHNCQPFPAGKGLDILVSAIFL